MELRLESLSEEDPSKPQDQSFENNQENEKDKNTFRYFSREAFILPLNERTLKKRLEKEVEEELKNKQIENEKKVEIEQKLKLLELHERKKRQKEEEESKKKRQERKLQEEHQEIDKLVFSLEWQLRPTTKLLLLFLL